MRTVIFSALFFASALTARAEVGYDLPPSAARIADSASRHVSFGPDRYLVVNGTVIRAKLGQTDLSARALVDRVEGEWLAAHAEQYLARAQESSEINVELELRRPFRFDARGRSMFGKIFGGIPDPDAPFLEAFIKTGTLGENASDGAMLAAYESGDGAITDVWLMQLDQDFRPLDYIGAGPGSNGVLPAANVEGYPGSRQGVTVSEITETAETHSVTFTGPGSLEGHAAHYEALFRESGLVQAPTSRRSGEILLRFADQKRDIAVFITDDASNSGEVIDIIQISSSERSIQ